MYNVPKLRYISQFTLELFCDFVAHILLYEVIHPYGRTLHIVKCVLKVTKSLKHDNIHKFYLCLKTVYALKLCLHFTEST